MDLCALVDTVRVEINRDLQAEAGLSLAENLVLCHVAMAPGERLRMIELATLLNVAKSAITKTVDRLEERELLTRTRDPGDRRTVYAALTAAGRKTFATAQPAFASAVQRHFSDRLDRSELQALRHAAGKTVGASKASRAGSR
jgi:DNA-binding MarR family transcriptional regulator